MSQRLVVFLPVGAAGLFVLLSLMLRDSLPDPLAIHFGISGRADGFMEFWPAVTINALLIALPALIALLLGKGIKDKRLEGIFYWLPIGLTAVFFSISSYLMLIQINLVFATEASLGVNFFLLVFSPIILLLTLLLRKPRVEIGDKQLRIKSLGISLLRVPFAEIRSVGVEQIRPMDFGGWGLRVNLSGDVAFLPSAGAAVALHRTNGKKIFIRSDSADELSAEIERKIK